MRARISPPSAGPTARAMLMPSELSATALLRSFFWTSSGTMACQVGPISAAPMPPRKVSATSDVTDCSPAADSSIRLMLVPASRNWMPIRNLRRSRISASTPAGIASRNTGNVAAACTSATAAGDVDKSVISHALATSRMKLPVLPITVATQSTANTDCRKGPKPLDVTFDAVVLLFMSVMASSRADLARRSAESRRPIQGARRTRWRP
jgi:hypothetical protein